MAGQKIRIRLKAYDHEAIDASARKIVETALSDPYVQLLWNGREVARTKHKRVTLAPGSRPFYPGSPYNL